MYIYIGSIYIGEIDGWTNGLIRRIRASHDQSAPVPMHPFHSAREKEKHKGG